MLTNYRRARVTRLTEDKATLEKSASTVQSKREQITPKWRKRGGSSLEIE